MTETRKTRPVSWIKAALKDFKGFPEGAQAVILTALTHRGGGWQGGRCEANARAGLRNI
jgi:hypothetical protein